ncbi:MAG TPA: Ig-like domain-containing protein [Candidatus Saccharimonadales bacterium]|nr:Ig-like domain-containing protein [Candidatus Saccharimonadales bacterium]
MRHTWINRTAPVIVGVTVVGCAWYSISSQPKPLAVVPTPTANATPMPNSVVSNTALAPVADFAPTVSKLGTQLQFSLPIAKLQNVQKVEFYIEHTLVGAAFSAPYQVSVNEDNLTAGTHSVTAKLYTQSNTTQTTPALFTATPSPAHHAADVTGTQDDTTVTTTPPATSSTLATPTGLTASAGADGVSVQLSWTASANAASYQIWRDGSLVATSTSPTFTDTGLTAGQTYDYSVIAINGSLQSAPSAQVGVTMPLTPAPPVHDPPDSNQGDTTGTTDDTGGLDDEEDLPQIKPQT